MKWQNLRTPILIALCVLGVVGLAILLLWPITDMIASHDVGALTGAWRATQLRIAREAARSQLLTLGAGVFAAGALAFTALNFRLSRQQFQQSSQQFTEQLELSRKAAQDSAEAERRTLELTEQGQVTDRYTKAIKQLGSEKMDVRIGGIYALERIARDSGRDHPTVMDVLAAFVREHSRESEWLGADGIPATRPDVQAALTVIGRRDTTHDSGQVNLANASLPRADLREACWHLATFYKADLTGAIFLKSDLSNAVLYGADLTRSILAGANLRQANMSMANLSDAILTAANMFEANFAGADLAGADLRLGKLSGANLLARNVPQADLAEVSLDDALLPKSVPLPDGWVRNPATDRLMRSSPVVALPPD